MASPTATGDRHRGSRTATDTLRDPGPARRRAESGVFYPAGDRPLVEVLHTDGGWYPGRLHAWIPDGPGWRAVVSYRVGPGCQHYLDVPADLVRRSEELRRSEEW
jgi:hypothetical protein